jgi:hypothetical protein
LIKIPELIDISPEVRDEQKRYDDLLARDKEISAKVQRLRAKKADGESIVDKDARVAFVLAGKSVPPIADINTELSNALLQWRSIEDAKEVQSRNLEKAKRAAGQKLCADLKPAHDEVMVRLCSSLTDAHSAWNELFAIKRGLLNKGAGLHGICQVEPEFLDDPADRAGAFARFHPARAGNLNGPGAAW